MGMPTWDGFMAPVLRQLLPGAVIKRRDLEELVIAAEHLTDEERTETLSSGQLEYRNRIGWATSYLSRVGVIARPARGQHVITDIGRKLLADHPNGITEKDLRALAGDATAPHTWKALQAREGKAGTVGADPERVSYVSVLDPEEQVSDGIARINATVADELRTRLHDNSPGFFEETVVSLLVAMRYGGAGRPGHGREGLQRRRDRWDHRPGRARCESGVCPGQAVCPGQLCRAPRIAGVRRGAQRQGRRRRLHHHRPGLEGCRRVCRRVCRGRADRITLIDGITLAELMSRYGVGVQVKQTLQIVEVNEDFE